MGMRAKSRTSTRAKILATVAIVGGTAGVAGLGTFGTFTSATSATGQTDSTGTVVLDFGLGVLQANRLAVGASDIAPGDTLQRGYELRNSGSLNMASITMGIAAPTSSVLDTDGTNGLKVKIDKCATPWVETGSSAPFTYTCVGGSTSVLAYTSVTSIKAGAVTLPSLSALTAGGSDYLVATFQLPSTADNSFQNKSSTLDITFTGTQRAATNK